MKSLVDHLSNYAEYHRDRRNVVTHFAGIPMIVLAVEGLLSRSSLVLGPVTVTPALVVTVATVAFYLRLDWRYGLAMAGVLGLALAAGARLAAGRTASWLGLSLGLFAVGWIVQLVGHVFEGRKPAFVDDLAGLAIGPLFVVAEAGFLVGLRDEVRQAIERRAGPTRSGRAAAA